MNYVLDLYSKQYAHTSETLNLHEYVFDGDCTYPALDCTPYVSERRVGIEFILFT